MILNSRRYPSIMSTVIMTGESNKENVPETEEKVIPIFSVESILFFIYIYKLINDILIIDVKHFRVMSILGTYLPFTTD